jgi:hypothetical protein
MGELTEKQNAFVLAYLETANAAEAYRRAYDVDENARDSWIYVEACQMLDNPKIAIRLKEVRDEAKSLSLYNSLAALEEYEAARALAQVEKNPSAMVSAIGGKVKLFGLDRPVRSEITGRDGNPIKTEEVGTGATKLATFIEALAERSGTTGPTDAG